MSSIDDDMDRRLDNWARWYLSGHQSNRVSSIYRQGSHDGRSRRYNETPMPVINGEAIETDTAIGRIAVDLRHALRARYLRLAPEGYTMRTSSEIQVAAALFCSYDTYLRRVGNGRRAVREELLLARRREGFT